MKNIIAILICFYPVLLFAQEITINEVSQENNSVIIQYDLQGEGTFNVKIYYSTNDGESWKGPLNQLTGAAGDKQTQGKNKVVVWDILAEKTELSGFYQFKILAELENQFASDSGTFTDEREGQVYKWVKIGKQIWMAENLRATKYNDGTPIPNVTGNSAWTRLSSRAYCWYKNDMGNKLTYGALYNWNAVNTGKLCPEGWHVPSDTEWTTLTDYLGGTGVAGGKMKSITGWDSPNTGATNSSGFSALPVGRRRYHGSFSNVGSNGYWWSSAEFNSSNAWNRSLYNNNADVYRYSVSKAHGFSVRCVRDN